VHKNTRSNDWFREKVSSVHGSLYDVSHVNYENMHKHFTLTCSKHGEFQTTGQSFLIKKRGCQKCAHEKSRIGRKTNFLGLSNAEVIIAAKKIHGDLYDYSKLEYVNTTTPFIIVCKIHGEFKQIYPIHITKGCRCPTCFPQFGAGRKISADRFKGEVLALDKEYVTRLCKKHGQYKTYRNNALYKNTSCPKCTTKTSVWQKEITAFVKDLVTGVKTDHRIFPESSKNVDIFVPSLTLAIECNGSYHHSTGAKNYQSLPVELREAEVRREELWKSRECKKLGIRLITIVENEWLEKREVVERFLKANLRKSQTIGARELTCVKIDRSDAKEFLEAWHLQGAGHHTNHVKYYALKKESKIVSVMSFTDVHYRRTYETGGGWEIVRYATSRNILGGAKRLLSNFLRENTCTEIISFCDSRLFTGAVYERLGFTKVKEYPFDYMFLKGKRLYHKAHFTKNRLNKLGIPDAKFATTEKHSIFKLFLPGQMKYRLLINP